MNEAHQFAKEDLQLLIDHLWDSGSRVLGPVERDGTVLFDEVRKVRELPVGRRDSQSGGHYRIGPGADGEIFGVVHGPASLKGFFFAAREPLLEVRREGRGMQVDEILPEHQSIAVLGARACDLAGVGVQDRIFLHDRFHDAHYALRRQQLTIVAVECTRSVSTCFCSSMGTGPALRGGYDLGLTELDDGFVARAGSDRGVALLAAMHAAVAAPGAVDAARQAVENCEAAIERRFDPTGLRELLPAQAHHPRWADVADRCLSCANCTLVCPTCFCHTVTDVTELRGDRSRRVREWQSCFSPDHAQIHGKNFRPSTRERYRQWLTHKLATWIDQFGQSGCVGCGRCITWCPVAIDLTEEVAALREPAQAKR